MRAEENCTALDAARTRFRELADRITSCQTDVQRELREIAAGLGKPADYDAFLEDGIAGTAHHEMYRWAETLAEDLGADAAELLRTASRTHTRHLEEAWRERAHERHFHQRWPLPAPLPEARATSLLGLTAATARATAHSIRADVERLRGLCDLLPLPRDTDRIEWERDEAALRRHPALHLYLVLDAVLREELDPAVDLLERAGQLTADA